MKFIAQNTVEINLHHIEGPIVYTNNLEDKNIIILYIYKLFHFFTKDENEFFKFNYINKNMIFFWDFEIKKSSKILSYYSFSPKSSLKKEYHKVLKLFENYPEKNYDDIDKKGEFIEKTKDIPIEIFINIIINILITRKGLQSLYSYEKKEKKDKYLNLLKFAKDVLYSKCLPSKMSKLLKLYLDKDYFKILIKNKLDEEGFFISLYGLRYCLNSLKNERNKINFYSSLLHTKKNNFPHDKNQIPGIQPVQNKRFEIFKILAKRIDGLNQTYYEIYYNKFNNVLDIRYLILNFILISYLLFSECLGELDYKMREFFQFEKNENLIETMKNDYKEISVRLKSENIDSIEIFMNLIYEDLSKLIINSNSFLDKYEKDEFENKVDEIIIEAIDKYNEYKANYIKENYDFIDEEEKEKNKNYLLIKELIPIEELNNNEKFFILTKFHREEENEKNYFENYILKVGLKTCFEKYPLLCQVLFYRKEVENMKYLPHINDLCNYLIKKFSHKISRKEANEKAIKDTDFRIDQTLLNNFIQSWAQIEEKKSLSIESPLINFLIDKNQQSSTNLINIKYDKFIQMQKNFLFSIINSIKSRENKDAILYFYLDNINKKINIQDSNNNHIDLSDIDLKSLIVKNSKRNIFNKENDVINYTNYNSFIYDLDSIEKELGELILSGKCLFEDKIKKYFIFWNEDNKEILTMLTNRYEQKKINEKEMEKMMNFVKKNYLGGKSMKEFYESFFILFFYLNEDKNELNLENNLNDLLQIISTDLNLSEDFKFFFKKEGKDIKLNQIIEIFLYLEHLYFVINFNNIEDINKEIKDINIIINRIEKSGIKDELTNALRRYITRYLLGNKNILVDFKEENLINKLNKSDLWGINEMKKFEGIKHKLNTELNNIYIKIEQALTLYEKLGQNEQESMNDLIKEIEINDELDDYTN